MVFVMRSATVRRCDSLATNGAVSRLLNRLTQLYLYAPYTIQIILTSLESVSSTLCLVREELRDARNDSYALVERIVQRPVQ